MAYQPKSYRKFLATTAAAAMAATAVVPAAVSADEHEEQRFSDYGPNDTGYEQAMRLADKNLITGFPDGTFKPNERLSRFHAAVFFYRTMELEISDERMFEIIDGLDDVSRDYVYAREIAAGIDADIFRVGDNFRPQENLLRSQFASLLVRAFELEPKPGEGATVTDIEGNWHQNNIEIVLQNEIFRGVPQEDGTRVFNAGNPMTRGQMSQTLVESFDAAGMELPVREVEEDDEEEVELAVESVTASNPADTNNVEVMGTATGADRVELTLVGAGSDETVDVELDGNNFNYTFESLPAGSYEVQAVAFDGEESSALVTSNPVVITPADSEVSTGIAGFVTESGSIASDGVAGVEVSVGDRTATSDFDGYFELELPAGLHDVEFVSGAGVYVEENVEVINGKISPLVINEQDLGIPDIEENTITASLSDADGDPVSGDTIELQAEVDGEWVGIFEAQTGSNGIKQFTSSDVAGTGFTFDTTYRFKVGPNHYSNEVTFEPNPSQNIDLSAQLGPNPDTAEEMDLTINLRDSGGDDDINLEGDLDLLTWEPGANKWTTADTVNLTTGNSATFEGLKAFTDDEFKVMYRPDTTSEKDDYAVSVFSVTVDEEGSNQTENVRLRSAAEASIATVNARTADNGDFVSGDTLTIEILDEDNVELYTQDQIVGTSTDTVTIDTASLGQLPYGDYSVRIHSDGGYIHPGQQEFDLTVSSSRAFKNADVTVGSPITFVGDSKFFDDAQAGAIQYMTIYNKDGEPYTTRRFIKGSTTQNTVTLPRGDDYEVVSKGFRLVEEEKEFNVARSSADTVTVAEPPVAEDGATVEGRVLRNNASVEGAQVTAYLGGRAIASSTTSPNGAYTITTPHAGTYTFVVRGEHGDQNIATYTEEVEVEAGKNIRNQHLRVSGLESGEFTFNTNAAIQDAVILDEYAAALGSRAFTLADDVGLEGRWTSAASNVTQTATVLKASNMTQGEYTVRIRPVSSQLEPVTTTVNIGREGAKVSRSIEFPATADMRTAQFNFIDSEDGTGKAFEGRAVVRNSSGEIYKVTNINSTTTSLDLPDEDTYMIRFVSENNFVAEKSVTIDGRNLSDLDVELESNQ